MALKEAKSMKSLERAAKTRSFWAKIKNSNDTHQQQCFMGIVWGLFFIVDDSLRIVYYCLLSIIHEPFQWPINKLKKSSYHPNTIQTWTSLVASLVAHPKKRKGWTLELFNCWTYQHTEWIQLTNRYKLVRKCLEQAATSRLEMAIQFHLRRRNAQQNVGHVWISGTRLYGYIFLYILFSSYRCITVQL